VSLLVVVARLAEVRSAQRREQCWWIRALDDQKYFLAAERREAYSYLSHIEDVVVSTVECLSQEGHDQRLALSSIEGHSRERWCQTTGYEAPLTDE
jgi:hypothetical protein